MNYMGDSTFWNKRFGDMPLTLREVDPCLLRDADLFQSGQSVLDIACGDGRNSLFLARRSVSVHGVDFSLEALQRLQHYAAQENLSVETQQMDLSSSAIYCLAGSYDAIIVNHYRPDPQFYPHLLSLLKKGALLWINGFREKPYDSDIITEQDVFSPSDFTVMKDCCLLDALEYQVGQRQYIRYLWKK